MDKKIATEIAENHLKTKPELVTGYRLTIKNGVKVDRDWYFGYIIVCDLNIPKSEQEKFAGAFGFIVNSKTSEISEISYHGWVDLGLAFHDDPYSDANE